MALCAACCCCLFLSLSLVVYRSPLQLMRTNDRDPSNGSHTDDFDLSISPTPEYHTARETHTAQTLLSSRFLMCTLCYGLSKRSQWTLHRHTCAVLFARPLSFSLPLSLRLFFALIFFLCCNVFGFCWLARIYVAIGLGFFSYFYYAPCALIEFPLH